MRIAVVALVGALFVAPVLPARAAAPPGAVLITRRDMALVGGATLGRLDHTFLGTRMNVRLVSDARGLSLFASPF